MDMPPPAAEPPLPTGRVTLPFSIVRFARITVSPALPAGATMSNTRPCWAPSRNVLPSPPPRIVNFSLAAAPRGVLLATVRLLTW